MFGLLYLLGWFGTVALTVGLWMRGRSGRSVLLATLFGLVVGLFWPITLWIAAGVWWRRRAASPPPGSSAQAGLLPLLGTATVCAAGSIMTLVALGTAAPPPAPASLASSTPTTAASAPLPVALPAPLLVVEVVDGDTVDLIDGRRVRLLGIDAPEGRVRVCGDDRVRPYVVAGPPGASRLGSHAGRD